MTRDEFIDGYCERSGITHDQFFEYGDAVPCDCGDGTCAGWRYETQPDANDRCGHPDCKGSLVCAEPGCEAMHPNACAADKSAAGWRCHRHGLVIAKQASLNLPSPGDLIVCGASGKETLRFKPTGEIELGDGYTPTQAAEEFIAALRDNLPSVQHVSKLEAELADRDEWLRAAAEHATALETALVWFREHCADTASHLAGCEYLRGTTCSCGLHDALQVPTGVNMPAGAMITTRSARVRAPRGFTLVINGTPMGDEATVRAGDVIQLQAET